MEMLFGDLGLVQFGENMLADSSFFGVEGSCLLVGQNVVTGGSEGVWKIADVVGGGGRCLALCGVWNVGDASRW